MKVKWYGQACLRVMATDGTSVITDPYTPETSGYMPVPDEADVVIISSDNDTFHCRADLIPGKPTVINALKLAQTDRQKVEKGICFQAIEAMEALDHMYHAPDQNGMYRFEVDGIHVGHMGDMGNALSDEQMRFFAGIDVLLALAGGHPVIRLDDLKAMIDRVQPKLIVPMHYRTLRYKPRHMFWIQSFLNYFADEDVDFACDSEFAVTKETLPKKVRVMVLAHAC